MTDIGVFRDVARTDALRLVEKQGAVEDAVPKSIGKFALNVVSSFVVSFGDVHYLQRLEGENNAIRTKFNQALESHYGRTISDQLRLATDGKPLSARSVRDALAQADVQREHAIQDAARDPGNAVKRNRAISFIMKDIAFPDTPRGKLMQEYVETALENVAQGVLTLDRTTDKRLLAELGGSLAKRLDDYMMRALGSHFEEQYEIGDDDNIKKSYSEAMKTLDDTGGIDRLCKEIPTLHGALCVETRNFVNAVTTMIGRVTGDMEAIGGRFFGGSDAPTGLTGINITNSDPHKHGNRVIILTFDNGKNLVYKPRDVRIDELLTGKDLTDERHSMLELTGILLSGNKDSLPTYRFMPRKDDHTVDYGYVQCLSNRTVEDQVVSPQGARQFYRELGRCMAAMALVGATDLHHENLMVSGGRPHFIDLEFAFSNQSMSTMTEIFDGRAERITDLLDTMGLDHALTKGVDLNSDRPEFIVVDDRMTLRPREQNADPVVENFLIERSDGALRNNIEDKLFSVYKEEIASGFTEVLTAFRNHPREFGVFVGESRGVHLRYHPISTTDQRAGVSRYKNLVTGPRGHDLSTVTKDLDDQTRNLEMNVESSVFLGRAVPPVSKLAPSMLKSYRDHDIPYYTRTISRRAVYHNGTDRIMEDYFPEDGNRFVARLLESLPSLGDACIKQLRENIEGWVGNLNVDVERSITREHRNLLALVH